MTLGACLRRGVQNARQNREHTEPETRNGVPGSRNDGARGNRKGRGGYRSTPKKT